MWVLSLGQEDPLKEGIATHSNILAWRILWTEEPGWATVHGVTESDTTEETEHAYGLLVIVGDGRFGYF